MRSNFYNMIFIEDNLIPFIREGIPVTMANNFVCINGLGKYRVLQKPEQIEDTDNIEEKFRNYSSETPWIGKENDGIMYLYRAQINEEKLSLEESNSDSVYLGVNANEKDKISVLNGKVFFRNFYNGEQTSLIKFDEGTVLKIEKEDVLIIIEWNGEKFICR